MKQQHIDTLAGMIAKGAIVVCGTGTSLAATREKTASWLGLLQDGLKEVEDVVSAPRVADQVKQHRDSLDAVVAAAKSANARDFRASMIPLLSAAEYIQQELRDPHQGTRYKQWVDRALGSLTVKDTAVTDAIKAVEKAGALIATTNYDTVLESALESPSILLADAGVAEWGLGRHRAVMHFAGIWREPKTIVLSYSDYGLITRDTQTESVLRALFILRPVIFVGIEGGVFDPLFERLLRWAAELDAHPRYALIANKATAERLQNPLEQQHVEVLSVDDHSKIPTLLIAAAQRSRSVSNLGSALSHNIEGTWHYEVENNSKQYSANIRVTQTGNELKAIFAINSSSGQSRIVHLRGIIVGDTVAMSAIRSHDLGADESNPSSNALNAFVLCVSADGATMSGGHLWRSDSVRGNLSATWVRR